MSYSKIIPCTCTHTKKMILCPGKIRILTPPPPILCPGKLRFLFHDRNLIQCFDAKKSISEDKNNKKATLVSFFPGISSFLVCFCFFFLQEEISVDSHKFIWCMK